MTDPFGPLPQRKSRGSGYSTTAITMAVISLLSGLAALVIGKSSGASVPLNVVITALSAVAALIYALLAKYKGEPRASIALVVAGLAILLAVLIVIL